MHFLECSISHELDDEDRKKNNAGESDGYLNDAKITKHFEGTDLLIDKEPNSFITNL